MRQKCKKKSTIQKVLRTLILHNNNSRKLLTNKWKKKLFNKKTGNVTLFQPKLICQFFRIHMNFFRFFSNFWKPRLSKNVGVVFANFFNRFSRIFLSVMCSLFAKTCPNFVTFDRFFKTKKKSQRFEKNLKKIICIRKNWQINFGLKKLGFFVEHFFF